MIIFIHAAFFIILVLYWSTPNITLVANVFTLSRTRNGPLPRKQHRLLQSPPFVIKKRLSLRYTLKYWRRERGAAAAPECAGEHQ
ncbi:hypothetical protein B0H12DRAFT_1125837 [Mycena haematopus]|nr:hypothetical protein B0H12DRAFT_1125837 [Mycena haematopus]